MPELLLNICIISGCWYPMPIDPCGGGVCENTLIFGFCMPVIFGTTPLIRVGCGCCSTSLSCCSAPHLKHFTTYHRVYSANSVWCCQSLPSSHWRWYLTLTGLCVHWSNGHLTSSYRREHCTLWNETSVSIKAQRFYLYAPAPWVLVTQIAVVCIDLVLLDALLLATLHLRPVLK